MKRKLLMGFTVVAMFLAHTSHADFTFYSDSTDCNEVVGNWVGTSTATSGLIKCDYNGSGVVSPVENNSQFKLSLNAKKTSGSILCPANYSATFNAVCTNGVVTVKTEYGNLMGGFSRSNGGNAKGRLTISPGIFVDIDIRFRYAG